MHNNLIFHAIYDTETFWVLVLYFVLRRYGPLARKYQYLLIINILINIGSSILKMVEVLDINLGLVISTLYGILKLFGQLAEVKVRWANRFQICKYQLLRLEWCWIPGGILLCPCGWKCNRCRRKLRKQISHCHDCLFGWSELWLFILAISFDLFHSIMMRTLELTQPQGDD